jgi:adenosylhomocysteine nucleosidase
MHALSHVGIFVATRWELQAIRSALAGLGLGAFEENTGGGRRRMASHQGTCRISLVQSGIGPERAARASRQLVQEEPCDLIISTGFACALTPSGIADLLIGTEAVRMEPSVDRMVPIRCDSSFQTIALRVAKEGSLPARSGRIVTVDRVMVSARHKHAVADSTGAIGLDMESAALGAVAAEHQIPFLIARTVSDLVDEELPADFNLMLTRAGWLRGVLRLTRPSSLCSLWRLKTQATVAAGSLEAFFKRFLSVLLTEADRTESMEKHGG